MYIFIVILKPEGKIWIFTCLFYYVPILFFLAVCNPFNFNILSVVEYPVICIHNLKFNKLMGMMELVKIAKTNLRNNLKKKLSQMTASEIAEQSKIITNKVSYINYNFLRNKNAPKSKFFNYNVIF